MTELLWLFPILASIALVLGACRGESAGRILLEAGKSFAKLSVGMVLLGVVLEGVLFVIPRLF